MLKTFLLAAAATLFANGASADVTYVLRPTTVPSSAKVLPMDAFSATPSTGSNNPAPTVPPDPALDWIYTSYGWNAAVGKVKNFDITLHLGDDYHYSAPGPIDRTKNDYCYNDQDHDYHNEMLIAVRSTALGADIHFFDRHETNYNSRPGKFRIVMHCWLHGLGQNYPTTETLTVSANE